MKNRKIHLVRDTVTYMNGDIRHMMYCGNMSERNIFTSYRMAITCDSCWNVMVKEN